jgi:hypothetical protein
VIENPDGTRHAIKGADININNGPFSEENSSDKDNQKKKQTE